MHNTVAQNYSKKRYIEGSITPSSPQVSSPCNQHCGHSRASVPEPHGLTAISPQSLVLVISAVDSPELSAKATQDNERQPTQTIDWKSSTLRLHKPVTHALTENAGTYTFLIFLFLY